MAAPKRTTKAQSEEGIARFLAALDAHTKLLAFFFGLCFVAALLVLAVWFPQPTAFQYTVFRIVLALAAAGVAGVIPGMISLKAQPGTALLIHAGGALAVFVMVYMFAPAAVKLEEKPAPAAQPLKISGVDAIENGVHILDFTPPLTRHTVRLSNIGEAPVHISFIGFPEKYFYTNLADEKSLFQGHEDRDMSVILMLTVPEQKEYVFEVSDSAGGTARVAVRIKEGWREYIEQQIQKIDAKLEQGANVLELYHTAKRVIASSGYKELSAPLQEVLTGQLLDAANQPEAAALAYAKADKEDSKLAERFIPYSSPEEMIALVDIYKKNNYNSIQILLKKNIGSALLSKYLQISRGDTEGKVISAVKVTSTMWRAISGDIENDGSDDAYIGLLLANQFLNMGVVDINKNGELYIDGVAMKNPGDVLVYIDQHAESLNPVLVQTGGYDVLNTVLLENAKTGNVVISQHLASRGVIDVGANAILEANSIKIINEARKNK